MMSRRQACYLAAQKEIQEARSLDLWGADKDREIHAAEMRAACLLRGCSGKRLAQTFENKIAAIQEGRA